MEANSCNCGCHRCGMGDHRQGVSSFFIHDSEEIFRVLGLKEGDFFLDLGCGFGDYSIRASSIVGSSGRVLALDRDEAAIDDLNVRIGRKGLFNVTTRTGDITRAIPLEDDCVDLSLLSTVLHIPEVVDRVSELGAEIRRVLRPGGLLAVIEVYGEGELFGPPTGVRISPDEAERLLSPCGFRALDLFDFGRSYLLRFEMS
ncbi:class I SAM-dependent methyltransferase [Dethiosulfovibrio sp. F2B]|uniref:class I SAM-dependent methyltransferase n=1 Tax=Dethiosulfovibrio faecalis TaxID=2720018 RepID=UPI001F1E9340|nr:class I SAM-dependent methyltransferase [Dethiosulfovibrio faecalis]MCF4152307.1 class I SAM-dependent methyltransferase [Dethiosulfovibrio faecalis]